MLDYEITRVFSAQGQNLIIILLILIHNFVHASSPQLPPGDGSWVLLAYQCMVLTWQQQLIWSSQVKKMIYSSWLGNRFSVSHWLWRKTQHSPRSCSQPSCKHNVNQSKEETSTPKTVGQWVERSWCYGSVNNQLSSTEKFWR